MSSLIIGVDPGDSTGVAIFRNGSFLYAKQGTPDEMIILVELVLGHCDKNDKVVLACERFTSGRQAHSHQPTAQRINGVMNHVAQKYGVKFVQQGPADAWAIAPNPMLKKLDLYQTAHDVDQRDANDANMAVRHALLTMAREFNTDFERLVREAGGFDS